MQRVEKSIRVMAPVAEVYKYWRNFENFPNFMQYVKDVKVLDGEGKRSHWKIQGPLGTTVEFDARLTTDEENRSLGWNSDGGTVETSGTVNFTETDFNTVVHVVMNWYDPPAGAVGEAVGKMVYNPETMVTEDLERFKGVIEGRTSPTGSAR